MWGNTWSAGGMARVIRSVADIQTGIEKGNHVLPTYTENHHSERESQRVANYSVPKIVHKANALIILRLMCDMTLYVAFFF